MRVRVPLQRTAPDGTQEHYCTACETYHAISAFAPNVLLHRVYRCRASALAKHRNYRQAIPKDKRWCLRLLRALRRREGHSDEVQRLDVSDIEAAVLTAAKAGSLRMQARGVVIVRRVASAPLSPSNLVAVTQRKRPSRGRKEADSNVDRMQVEDPQPAHAMEVQ